jgi:hypothetical protein
MKKPKKFSKKNKAIKKAKKQAQPKQVQLRSKTARANIAEGTRLFALAGRPTKAKFVKVYGPQGSKMTWAQRACANGTACKHLVVPLFTRDFVVCLGAVPLKELWLSTVV